MDYETPKVRCAIYTRKSSEAGLEKEFNSLDAQRETCEAYILSQIQAGWQAINASYDDGGLSGANLERPALLKLLKDIRIGLVDVVVVYKVDRLTRSLTDFVKIIEVFDSFDVSFVSITQQFNTTSAMGRLTLNVLLSFAQFERELSGERIRDKIAASKRKGMWMGGHPPLGYDPKDRSLIINVVEAKTVRILFSLYLKLGNVRLVKEAADGLGLITKTRVTQSQNLRGGKLLSRGYIYALLSNPVYAGQIVHKDKVYVGRHEAIIDHRTWNAVQGRLAANTTGERRRRTVKHPSLLAGILYDADGDRLSPSHTVKNGKRYRYYVSRQLIKNSGGPQLAGWRIPAWEIEAAVLNEMRELFVDEQRLLEITGLSSQTPERTLSALAAAKKQLQILEAGNSFDRSALLHTTVKRVVIAEETLSIELQRGQIANLLVNSLSNSPDAESDEETLLLSAPFQITRHGAVQKLIINGKEPTPNETVPHVGLIKAIARGRAWFDQIDSGNVTSLEDLARKLGFNRSYISRIIQFAFISPKVVEAAMNGKIDPSIPLNQLIQSRGLPVLWENQEALFGVN